MIPSVRPVNSETRASYNTANIANMMMSIEKWLVTKSKHTLIGPPGVLDLIDTLKQVTALYYYRSILIPYQLVQVTVTVTEEKRGGQRFY
jgi:hypothetical protein